MIKRFKFIALVLVLSVCLSCGKSLYDDMTESQTENVSGNGSGSTTPSDNTDPLDGSDDLDLTVSDDDDSDTPYEEPYTGGDDSGGSQQDNQNGQSVSTGDVITVADFLTKDISGGVWVYGYIVGSCKQNKSYADIEPPFTYSSALLMADHPNEKDIEKMMSLELKSGSKIREALDLTKHQELYQHKLKVFGYRTTYLGMKGMKGVSTWELDW